ncbi:MAG TPA: hypothetical protein VK171_12165, partial [Fimbriimonas sp.]|nr:hypothetical protein [Fimbriimonas sp.]
MKNNKLAKYALTLFCGATALTTLSAQAQAQATGFKLNPYRPRLVVLLHGVTPKPTESPEQKIGFSGHARHYWGFDFIKGLQGRNDESQMRVITPKVLGSMRLRTVDKAGWTPDTTDTNGVDLSPICFPMGWMAVPNNQTDDQTFIKDYIRLTTKNHGADTTMVMINTRDGSKHLMPQLAETIEEVYYSYKAAFGALPMDMQPQIYLVGHSFGGIIARGLLANPTAGDLWGNKLSATQRNMANFLRERVVLTQTLASPHEGTWIGDPAGDFADFIKTYGYSIVYSLIAAQNVLPGRNLTAAQVKEAAKQIIQGGLDAVSGKRDCLQDLLRVKEYNTGILAPNTAVRVPGGPLVPIFTAGGRNPSGTFMDKNRGTFLLGGSAWNPVTMIDLLRSPTRQANEAAKLVLIESLLHHEGYGYEGKKPFGTATLADGDRVQSPYKGVGPANARPLSQGWYPTNGVIKAVVGSLLDGLPYYSGFGDGEWDNDGFLGWDSANAIHMTNPNFIRVYDQNKYGGMLPWDQDHHGSIMFNPANGAWIHNELIRNAGPYIVGANTAARTTVWTPFQAQYAPKTGVKVEILELHDMAGDLDYWPNEADYRLEVRIGATQNIKNLSDGYRT